MEVSRLLVQASRTPVEAMSIAFPWSNSATDRSIDLPAFILRDAPPCVPPIESSPELAAAGGRLFQDANSSSSSTSSIGKNSDEAAEGGGGGEEEEVQSGCKAGPMDSLEDLEGVLPGKRAISKFYCGKSKSFTALSDAVLCSSIKDITKPENAYTRKRKNLLAFNNYFNKNPNSFQSRVGGLSKKPSSFRSMVGIAASTNFSGTIHGETSKSNPFSPSHDLPPLPPASRRIISNEIPHSADNFLSWRSFSLSDLKGAAGAEISVSETSESWSNNSREVE